MDVEAVGQLLRQVADSVVTPRFHALSDGDVAEKSPGEVVTIVDTEAEVLLTEGLSELLPGVPVVGEEAASTDPSLVGLLAHVPRAWLVDPLDGTAAFVAGSPDHAVMVALVEYGTTVAAAIYQPQYGALYLAEKGAGAYRDGKRVSRAPMVAGDLAGLRGGVYRRFLDVEALCAVEANEHRFGDLTPGPSAGVEYPRIARGEADFLLYWRAFPWDHAPGALVLEEAGGVARRLNGRDYRPGEPGRGLLVAGDRGTWDQVRDGLGLATA